ncbi:MAG: hypothetical protein F6K04_12025 [Leptolyngbya sp. SIO4C5]|nr:hypothetical protein [Leptolyngbya sp. SIO4C5]
MALKRKGETISFYLPGHYLVKLEARAATMNSDSKDLCAKQLTIAGLEDAPMRELYCQLGELERKLDRLLHQLPQGAAQMRAALAKAVFFILYEAAEITEADAASIANHIAPHSIRLPDDHDLGPAC